MSDALRLGELAVFSKNLVDFASSRSNRPSCLIVEAAGVAGAMLIPRISKLQFDPARF
ncbi:hypothetical protein [Paraburkholderia sp. RL17-373-BIF-A]|uniref:hypothetical protein n=1 Tax=Paraburkholderia sp. RL17-373-BIF-A TaxID=3031629 RepID=UPI0038BBC877